MLAVKAYPPRVGGGMGAHICSLSPGAHLVAKVKAPRLFHGAFVLARGAARERTPPAQRTAVNWSPPWRR